MTYQSKKHKEVFDKATVKKNAVDFDAIKLNASHPKGYTLYCAAKDIYLGTRHLC